ncbi:LysR family transcriptional regulator [Methylomicrobium sp. Wu6]|uniref:LysR family transcriptional regulator n=1 Tax=Methylomicrobium sp. Wu6 TaxID=3107928 RepID=UPI002DD6322D|nr:LysR family transcriptional regulator [Methylomicrobium sp. Wu6]MEC4747202.1 LysR family transcriptional regulator [Methylomicrobium sp. Wu6]
MTPQITLEQWRSLIAVVDAGGYAQAAEILHKSQSAVSYAVQKIESQLNVKAFEIQGRKAILTPTGQMLYRRALALVEEASDLERAAHTLSAGWEAEIHIAAEILFPSRLLLACLDRFGQESPRTRVEVIESVLGGTADALLKGEADLVISPQQPPGFLGELLMRIRLIAVAHADHPLHRYGRELTHHDLRAYRHLVVRDSGSKRDRRAVSVEVDQRWTVSQIATSIQAVSMGFGFAWLPEEHIHEELETGLLKPLSLREGGIIEVSLYIILANSDFVGPGVRRLAEIIRESVQPCNTANRKNFVLP